MGIESTMDRHHPPFHWNCICRCVCRASSSVNVRTRGSWIGVDQFKWWRGVQHMLNTKGNIECAMLSFDYVRFQIKMQFFFTWNQLNKNNERFIHRFIRKSLINEFLRKLRKIRPDARNFVMFHSVNKMSSMEQWLFAYYVHFFIFWYLFHSNYVKLFVKMERKTEDALIAVFKEKQVLKKWNAKREWRNEHSKTEQSSKLNHSLLFSQNNYTRECKYVKWNTESVNNHWKTNKFVCKLCFTWNGSNSENKANQKATNFDQQNGCVEANKRLFNWNWKWMK